MPEETAPPSPQPPSPQPPSPPPPTPPLLRVITPGATDEEIAALVAVVSAMAAGGGDDTPAPAASWSASARLHRATCTPGPGAWRSSGLPR